jgi:hypothetical protein
MPNTKRPSGTGNAPLIKVGHTASTKFGTNPNMQQKGDKTVRELNAK